MFHQDILNGNLIRVLVRIALISLSKGCNSKNRDRAAITILCNIPSQPSTHCNKAPSEYSKVLHIYGVHKWLKKKVIKEM